MRAHRPLHPHPPSTRSGWPSLRPGRVAATMTGVVALGVGTFWVVPGSTEGNETTQVLSAEAQRDPTDAVGEDPTGDPPAPIDSPLETTRALVRQVHDRREAELAAFFEAARLAEEEAARQAEAEAAAERRAAEEAWYAAAAAPTPPADDPEPAPAPAPAVPDGSVWDRLAQCESGGNWSINTGNGYYGGLQFSASSWAAVGGTGLPHQHSREVQIEMGERLRARQGWGAWPHCSRQLGLR